MANYKSIIDVESVAQATEEMNVLVEDGGSLKKVPAGGMIGGSDGAKMLVISYKNEAMETSLEDMPSGVYSANMTYEEFCSLTSNGELAGATLYIVENGVINYLTLEKIEISQFPDIYLYFRNSNKGSIPLIFHDDNTITEMATAN